MNRTWRPAPIAAALALLLSVPAGPAGSRAQEVIVEPSRLLTTGPLPFPLVESFLAVNPTDPSNLLASAMSTSADASVVYGSWDGGSSWHRVGGPGGAVFEGGDPMATFDGNGRAYFSTITPFRVWRSGDGGRTWDGPVALTGGRGYDRQWLAASARADSSRPLPLYGTAKRIAVVGGRERDVLVLARSPDGGRTFEETILPPDSGYLHAAGGLLVSRDGTVIVPFLVNYARQPGGGEVYRGGRWVVLSEDGGTTWSAPHFVGPNLQFGNSEWDLAMKGLGGGGTALDESGGRFAGRLYAVWPTAMEDRLQIVAARSTDGGLTWSEPVRVNDGGFRSNHSVPTVAVDGDGVVAVTWNDRRRDPSDTCFEHFVAVSVDGGHSFAPNRPVADLPTCPPPGSRWLNGGDTNGLVALPDGGFRVTWTAGEGRDLTIRTAVLRIR